MSWGRRGRGAVPWWKEHAIAVDHEGLTLVPVATVASGARIRWRNVLRIEVFKRDSLTSDLVCMRLQSVDGSVELNEEMEGWSSMLEALSIRLSGVLPKDVWFPDVVRRAFAASHRTIFSRE